MSKVCIIGAGFSGMSAAAYLSAAGHDVHVFEKNESAGGRARSFSTKNGYTFDMGPSWYWMPDIFEKFFGDFNKTPADYYSLELLTPAFDVVFSKEDTISVPANYIALQNLFEQIEKGAGEKLKSFMQEAKYKYETAMEKIVYMPGLSWNEFADFNLIKSAMRLQVFSSFSKHVRKYFTHPYLIALMEFPVLFLGAMPSDTPAMYSLMNYAGLVLGTWYPKGGISKVVEACRKVAEENGAIFHFKTPVDKINVVRNKVKNIEVKGNEISCDAVIASADYHHVEQDLLDKQYRNYTEKYWSQKTFAPSCLVYYVGVSRKISSMHHHTLFFDEGLDKHSVEIYKSPQWPTSPLFYVCCPSKTDDSVAPHGHENLFFLMPIAPGLEDNETLREKYFELMVKKLEVQTGEKFAEHIDFKKSYCIKDFVHDYNAYKGNAYGLANTLKQTAVMKPSVRNKKISNLFYAGQLTVPGPGVPPSLISGKIAAVQLVSQLKKEKHEIAL